MMRMLDFFFYQIRPFGIGDQRPATPEPPPDFNLTETPWFVPKETTAAETRNNNTVAAANTTIIPSTNVTHVMNKTTITTTTTLPNATANSMLSTVVTRL